MEPQRHEEHKGHEGNQLVNMITCLCQDFGLARHSSAQAMRRGMPMNRAMRKLFVFLLHTLLPWG
jgi:hypothetical protein